MKIEITPELLAGLKEKAQKATPGPWKPICSFGECNQVILAYDPAFKDKKDEAIPESGRTYGYECDDKFICDLNDNEYHVYRNLNEQNANANFIAAANPAVMLALLEKIEILENDNNLLKQTIKDLLKL